MPICVLSSEFALQRPSEGIYAGSQFSIINVINCGSAASLLPICVDSFE
jgi:hypothetical protein